MHRNSTLNYGNINTAEIERKKKVVSDLMALRRMKLQQHERLDSPFSLNFPKLPMIEAAIQSRDVDPLLEDTVLGKELNSVYGKKSLSKATEHYATLSEYTDASKNDDAENERAKFVTDITKRRKLKLEKDHQQRMRKQQSLFSKQLELTEKEYAYLSRSKADGGTTTFDEDLPKIIENAGKNLKTMERNLRSLKIKYAKDLSLQFLEKMRKEEMDILRKNNPEGMDAACWIMDIVLEKVDEQAKVNEGNLLESKLLEMLVIADKEQYESLQMEIARADATLSVMNDLVDETYIPLLHELCEECLYLAFMTVVCPENLVVQSSIQAASKKEKAKVKTANTELVNDSFTGIKRSREDFKSGLWNHSQTTIKQQVPVLPEQPAPGKVVASSVKPVVDEEGDNIVISAENVQPKVDTKFGSSVMMEKHANNEKALWKSCTMTVPDMTIPPKRTIGVNAVCLNSDHSVLAIGSSRGDILVYDVKLADFSLIRCVAFHGKNNDSVVALHWSLDSSRLISLTSQGCIAVWSASFAPYVSNNDMSSLNASKPYSCQQLTALCVLEHSRGDFKFKNANSSANEGIDSAALPNIVQFHPTLSCTGTQDSIIVALKDGQILKCNLFHNFQTRFKNHLVTELKGGPSESVVVLGSPPVLMQRNLKIGQDINVEVFRYHRVEIFHICFVLNCGDMISLDAKLNMCQWKHQPKYLNSFGWFVPFKKFQLAFTEDILLPVGDDEVVFEDTAQLSKAARSKRSKSKKVIDQERRRALLELEDLEVSRRKPWHTDEFPDLLEDRKGRAKKPSKLITRIFAPPGYHIEDASVDTARYCVVTVKRDSDLLVKLAYRTYEIAANAAKRLLHWSVSPSADRLHFMLLYDEYLPRTRKHVTITELDLTTMQLGRIGPIHIDLPTPVYDQCLQSGHCHFSVSRVNGYAGTEYIASNVTGRLYVHSLLSGRLMIQKLPEGDKSVRQYTELQFPSRLKKVTEDSYLLYIKPNSSIGYIVILPYVTSQSSAISSRVIKIANVDAEVERLAIRSTCNALLELKKQDVSDESSGIAWYCKEQSSQMELWGHKHMPLPLYMQLLLNIILDIVIAKVTDTRMPQEMRKKTWKQDWLRMQDYFSSENF